MKIRDNINEIGLNTVELHRTFMNTISPTFTSFILYLYDFIDEANLLCEDVLLYYKREESGKKFLYITFRKSKDTAVYSFDKSYIKLEGIIGKKALKFTKKFNYELTKFFVDMECEYVGTENKAQICIMDFTSKKMCVLSSNIKDIGSKNFIL